MLKLIKLLPLALLISACGDKVDTSTGPYKTVKEHFTSQSEPKALDAVWGSTRIFKVAVMNDGTDRSGYAAYVCEVLKEHQIGKNKTVQIVDVEKVRTGQWVELGIKHC